MSEKRDLFSKLEEMNELITRGPKPISYIVLDPDFPPTEPWVDTDDADGRRFLLCSTAILDSVRHAPVRRLPAFNATDAFYTFGIPILRRKDMPEGWPAVAA